MLCLIIISLIFLNIFTCSAIEYDYNNEKKFFKLAMIEDPLFTCKQDGKRTLLICPDNSKCDIVKSEYNVTHYFAEVRCICKKVIF